MPRLRGASSTDGDEDFSGLPASNRRNASPNRPANRFLPNDEITLEDADRDDISPEMRRELERRRLSQEEKRVARRLNPTFQSDPGGVHPLRMAMRTSLDCPPRIGGMHADRDDISPEMRRELERRRLSQEEKRVANAAAEYRRF
jgi:hypothetical protein